VERGDGQGIMGQMRVAAIEMGMDEVPGLTIFLWIFCGVWGEDDIF